MSGLDGSERPGPPFGQTILDCGCLVALPPSGPHACPAVRQGPSLTYPTFKEEGRQVRIRELENHRPRLIDYLRLKFEAEDWHGVQDAASYLRDLDNELFGLRY